MPTISNSEALSAIESLKRFFLQKEDSESDIKALDKMRSHVENQMFTVQPTRFIILFISRLCLFFPAHSESSLVLRKQEENPSIELSAEMNSNI